MEELLSLSIKKVKFSPSVDYLDTTFLRKLSFKKWKRLVIYWKRNSTFYQNNISQFIR